MLNLSLKQGSVAFDKTDKFSMILHDDKHFHEFNLAKDMSSDIKSAEHDTRSVLDSKDESKQ